MIKICFVCTGNTCRSIMAERLMKKRLKELGMNDIKLSSRGLSANGENITEQAKLALKKLKASAANRKSVKIGKIDEKTLYVTMTEQQKQILNNKNVLSFKSLLGFDIEDPYGQSQEKYLEVAKQIQQGIELLIEKILKWRGK